MPSPLLSTTMRRFFFSLMGAGLVLSARAQTPAASPAAAPNLNSEAIVLCYHRFEERPKDSLALKPSDFEAQMQALKDNGVQVISMDDFLAWRRGEKSIPARSAVITIDDGYLSGYNTAWPILKKYGYPFTMFIYTNYVKGGPNAGGQSMSWEQLAEMRDAGVDIESHTVSHSDLNARKGKTPEQYAAWLKTELADSKQMIEDKLGIKVKVLAYPYGKHNEEVRQAAMDAGYEAAFTVYGQRLAHDAPAATVGRYAIESTQPKIFTEAINFRSGPVEGTKSSVTQGMPAAAVMVTQPMNGETVTDPMPEIKVNLATFGNIDPKTVSMSVSGLGLVPAQYDPTSKNLSYKLTQKLYAPSTTVTVTATANGKKVETRWSFNNAGK